LVRPFGDGLFAGVQGIADGDGTGPERQGDSAAALRRTERRDMEARIEAFVEAGDGDVIGGNAFALQAPAGAETEIRGAQRNALRLR
jgi:hypothetical protein